MEKYIFDIPVTANMRIEILAANEEEAIEALYGYENHNNMIDEELIGLEYDIDENDLWDVRRMQNV